MANWIPFNHELFLPMVANLQGEHDAYLNSPRNDWTPQKRTALCTGKYL